MAQNSVCCWFSGQCGAKAQPQVPPVPFPEPPASLGSESWEGAGKPPAPLQLGVSRSEASAAQPLMVFIVVHQILTSTHHSEGFITPCPAKLCLSVIPAELISTESSEPPPSRALIPACFICLRGKGAQLPRGANGPPLPRENGAISAVPRPRGLQGVSCSSSLAALPRWHSGHTSGLCTHTALMIYCPCSGKRRLLP